MPEPFATVFEGVQEALAAWDIVVYDHQPFELYGVPSAYLVATDVQPEAERSDQSDVRIGEVQYTLRYFVALDGDVQAAYAQVYTAVRMVFAALSDATLGGRVSSVELDGTSIDPVAMGQDERPMLLAAFRLIINPEFYEALPPER